MLAAETHARAAALFLRASEATPETREAVFAAEPNAEVSAVARRLLRAHLGTPGPLDVPPLSRRPPDPAPEASAATGGSEPPFSSSPSSR
ncbi:MAG: hypothetical protein AAFQ43_01485 [Bacteroidota bacterium]